MEEWNFATCVLVLDLSQLRLMLVVKLRLLVGEVLLLGLDDHVKLGFLSFDLLDELLKVGDLLEVFDLLGSDLLIQHILLFLVSDLILELPLANESNLGVDVDTLTLCGEMMSHWSIGVSVWRVGRIILSWAVADERRMELCSWSTDTRTK